MNIIEHDNPNFVAIENFIMNTQLGEIIVEASEPMTVGIDKKGDLIYGSGGNTLKITHKTGLMDLLARIRPSTFTLKVEEDSETSLVASLKESAPNKDMIFQVPLLDHSVDGAVEIHSIRSMEK